MSPKLITLCITVLSLFTSTASSVSIESTIVSTINTIRRATGAQQMFTLSIDSSLSAIAQQLADQCPTNSVNTVNTLQSIPQTIYSNGMYYSQTLSTYTQDPGTVVSIWNNEASHWNAQITSCNPGQICNDWLSITYAFSTTIGCGYNSTCTGSNTYVCVLQAPQTSVNPPYIALSTSNENQCLCELCDKSLALGAAPVNLCLNAINSTLQNQLVTASKSTWSTQLGNQAQAFAEQCPQDATLLKNSGLPVIKLSTLNNTNTLANDITTQFSAQYIGCGMKTCNTDNSIPLFVCLYGSQDNNIQAGVLYNAFNAVSPGAKGSTGTTGTNTNTNTVSSNSNVDSSTGGSGFGAGSIAGTVIGVIVGILLLVALFIWCRRRSYKRNTYFTESDYYVDSESYGTSDRI